MCPAGTSCLGSFGRALRRVNAELFGECHRTRHGPRIAGEPPHHLGAAAQVQPVGGGQPPVELVEAAPRAHRGERRREPVLGRGRIVHRVRGEQGEPGSFGETGERVVRLLVERMPVVEELDDDVLAAEERGEAIELARRGIRPALGERTTYGSLAASGRHDPLAPRRSASSSSEYTGRPFSPPASCPAVIAPASRW